MTDIKEKIEKIKVSGDEIRTEVQSRVFGYVSTGLGLIVSLAWNEAIKALIELLFPLDQNSIIAKFVYAGLMTLVLVVVTIYFLKVFGLEGDKEERK